MSLLFAVPDIFGVTADYFLGISDIRLEMEVDEAKPLDRMEQVFGNLFTILCV